MSNTNDNPKPPLVSELASEPDMIELVEMFVAELPERISAMQTAIVENDVASLTRLSHQLKGAAGGYGFPCITDAAAILESSSKAAADTDRLRVELTALTDLCNRATAVPLE